MRTAPSFCVLITAVVVNVSCRGVLGPSCTDESGGVLRTEGVVPMDGTSTCRIAVTGDATRDATFALTVTCRITCES